MLSGSKILPHPRSAEYTWGAQKQFPIGNQIKQRAMRILLVLAVLGAPFAKSATVFEDRPALVVANDKLELTVMAEGGALANRSCAMTRPLSSGIPRDRTRPANPRFRDARGHLLALTVGPGISEERAAGLTGQARRTQPCGKRVPTQRTAARRS
jgi:hypothetical protein